MTLARRLLASGLLALAGGCAADQLVVEYSRSRPIDAIIVPGCPAAEDGGLSPCLARRVVWAAHLWELGLTRAVITSGAATYNRVPEAVALAAGLHALGVPAERIWLELDARHTDENVFYSLLLGRSLGFQSLAIASEAGQAKGGCSFIESWEQSCVPAGLDETIVAERLGNPTVAEALGGVRAASVPAASWLKVDAWEAQRIAAGGPSRPGSMALYLIKAPWGRLVGDPWYPPDPPERRPLSYAGYLEREASAASGAPTNALGAPPAGAVDEAP